MAEGKRTPPVSAPPGKRTPRWEEPEFQPISAFLLLFLLVFVSFRKGLADLRPERIELSLVEFEFELIVPEAMNS